MTTPTPMMAQYLTLKAEAEDCLLFYRMGDFFELFFDDARIASGVLDIALTSRGEHGGEKIPMCGVPVHAATAYLQRLIKAGHRVAIAEQTETPAEAKARGGVGAIMEDVRRSLVNRDRAGIGCGIGVLLTHVELKGFEVEFLVCHNVDSFICFRSYVFLLAKLWREDFSNKKLGKIGVFR